MSISPPAKKGLQKVTRFMGKPIYFGKSSGQPAREQVNGERKPIHFGKERHNECRKSAEGAPVPPRLGLEKAKSKD